ncbi:MAG: hypothetical protein M1823_003796 [Watsoniomyces obsoletus]|nr:MAG: hypothetical protein M1823_003796 [Watsoniomyces obsoletus]
MAIDGEPEYVVENILNSKWRYRKLVYKVRWNGYSDVHDEWVRVDNQSCNELVAEFHRENPGKPPDDRQPDPRSRPEGGRKVAGDQDDDPRGAAAEEKRLSRSTPPTSEGKGLPTGPSRRSRGWVIQGSVANATVGPTGSGSGPDADPPQGSRR